MPETLLEDVDLRLSYAVLASAAPETTALSDEGNGYFTRAILEGLRCNASSQPDGYVTLNRVDAEGPRGDDRVQSFAVPDGAAIQFG